MKKQYLSILLILGLFVASCSKDAQTTPDETPIEAGKGRLKINLSGADYASTEDAKGQKSSVQRQEINLEDGTTAVVTLENIGKYSPVVKRASNRAASTPVTNALPNGTYYGLLTYNGNTPTTTLLQVGAADQTVDLDEGTYEAILYSRGSAEEASLTGLSTVSWGDKGFYDIFAKDGAFLATPYTFEIKEGEETSINATLQHQFAEININITLPSSVTLTDAVTGSIPTDKINTYYLSSGSVATTFANDPNTPQTFTLTTTGSSASGKVIVGGNSARTLTLNIPGRTEPLEVLNVRVVPGERYNLNIDFATDEFIISHNSESNITDFGEDLPLKTFENLQSSNGFELDITSLDNSFAVKVNGQHVFTAQITLGGTTISDYHDIQFQGREDGELVAYGGKAYPANIAFEDGSVWGAGGVQSIWEMNGTDWSKPTVKLIVDGEGNVSLKATKTLGGELFDVVSVTEEEGTNTSRLDSGTSYSYTVSSQFNPVNWDKSGNNDVEITMVAYDDNKFEGLLKLKN